MTDTRKSAAPADGGGAAQNAASSAVHPFDEAVALQHEGGDVFTGRTTPEYGNMVGPFGGVTAACLLNACCLHPQRLGDPVALTVNYAGPIGDGPFRITARAARTNRSTQHFSLELRQDGDDQALTTATAVFAARRETWSATEPKYPDLPMPTAEQSSQRPMFPRSRVAWIRNYDMRFVHGTFPDPEQPMPGTDSVTSLWISDVPPRPLDFLSLAAISDCFFPRVYLRRQKIAPAGTVSITTYFHADARSFERQGTRPVLGTAKAMRFTGGFFDQSAEIWADDGELLATSHQIVYFKD